MSIKEAFLLSAGLGTRLRPLTDSVPKPLVMVCGKPLIQWNIDLLVELGCQKIIVNVHYKKEQIISYLASNPVEGVKFIVSEEDELLDTGGGLKKVLEYIEGERFFSWNSDVMLDPRVVQNQNGGIRNLVSLAESQASLVNLLVKPMTDDLDSCYSELGFDEQMRLCHFLKEDFTSGQVELKELTKFIYLGISILHRDVQAYFPTDRGIFSLTKDMFPGILSRYFRDGHGGIRGSACNCYWNDVGNPFRLDQASKEIGNILPLL